MATITPVRAVNKEVVTWTWTGVSTADTMVATDPFYGSSIVRGSAQITGTAGGGTFTLSASNDGVTYATLKDTGGSAITTTAAATWFEFETSAVYFKPTASGGAGDDMNFVLSFRVY